MKWIIIIALSGRASIFFTLIILNFKIRSKGVKHYSSYMENCQEIQFIVTYVPGCLVVSSWAMFNLVATVVKNSLARLSSSGIISIFSLKWRIIIAVCCHLNFQWEFFQVWLCSLLAPYIPTHFPHAHLVLANTDHDTNIIPPPPPTYYEPHTTLL